MSLDISFYTENEKEKWDDFVLNKSMNGTFLQTRSFIEYHAPEKFRDCSVCVYKGAELVGTLLACEVEDDDKRTFFAHKGSTYGGICISEKIYSATAVDELMSLLHEFLTENGYEKIYLKMVPDIYHKKNAALLDYFLYKNGYQCFDELNYFMNLERYKSDVTACFSKNKRRDYRYSLKNDLIFKKIDTKEGISEYYEVLLMNLRKLNLPVVHSLDDLYDLKFNRFPDIIDFYGVYHEEKIIAGSMVFIFDGRIFHTQYLSSNEEYLKLFPMDFLITNLIQTAVDLEMETFTFGICTEDQGRYLNLGLSRFKEGFGVEFCINRSYEKELDKPPLSGGIE